MCALRVFRWRASQRCPADATLRGAYTVLVCCLSSGLGDNQGEPRHGAALRPENELEFLTFALLPVCVELCAQVDAARSATRNFIRETLCGPYANCLGLLGANGVWNRMGERPFFLAATRKYPKVSSCKISNLTIPERSTKRSSGSDVCNL